MPQPQNPQAMNHTNKNPSNQGDHPDREKSQGNSKTGKPQDGREGGSHTRPSDK